MEMINNTSATFDDEYTVWLRELKAKVRSVQIKAAIKVNNELLNFYWELGEDIDEKQKISKWGDGIISRLSKDLTSEFPEIKGFSKRNLELIRKWFCFWKPLEAIAKQVATQIPWWHNVIIVTKVKNKDEALYYIENTIANNWSRSVLVHQIESGLYNRKGKSTTNFTLTLPQVQSDLAQQTIKDPYIFDFLTMTKQYNELELEKSLTDHITQFLLELGSGFAYIGRQVPLKVGDRDFKIDLLFYHSKLHCYVVIELKTVEFEPEHAGKLNFYLKAVDSQFKTDLDQASIGI